MARIGLALKAFFRVLSDEAAAARVLGALEAQTQPKLSTAPAAPVSTPREQVKPVSLRNDAVNLLAVLQREARLVDFFKENISGYDDAQIGAAVRDVHCASAKALERIFDLRPLMSEPEGATVTAGAAEADRIRLTGSVAGDPPYRGTLTHAGWQATKIQLPEWSGSAASAMVIAPAEIEVK